MPDPVSLPRVARDLPGRGFSVSFGPLRLAAGERLVLFGPNGAGKTTALRLLAGTLGGSGVADASYQPQRPYMFRGTGRYNLSLGLTGAEAGSAAALASRLGLSAKLDGPASSLSGGERQRLALARTLARSAPLVLLDEPLSAVDVRHRDLVLSVLAAGLGARPAVVVTHDREVAASIADRVAVMIDGSVRQIGGVDEVFTLPADDIVAEAVGVGNVLSGNVVSAEGPLVRVDVAGTAMWALGEHENGAPVKVVFGAETVTVHAGAAPRSSARNQWSGRVAEIRRVGRLVEIVVDVGPPVVAVITPGSHEALGLEIGSSVALTLKATAARAVPAPGR